MCSWDIDISPCDKFCANVSHSDQVVAIKRNFKMAPAAILDFLRSEIQRYFCFRDVSFSLSAKFHVNTCNTEKKQKKTVRTNALKISVNSGGVKNCS